MMLRSSRMLALIVTCMLTLMLLAAACERGPTPGYEGSWTNRNERFGSTLYFRERADGGYDIRYDVNRPEANYRVLCPWDGDCQEYLGNELVARWVLERWIDPDSGLPRMRSTRRPVEADPDDPTIWRIDEFELDADGLTMTAWTCEDQSMVYPTDRRGRRVYTKISDRVPEPVAQ